MSVVCLLKAEGGGRGAKRRGGGERTERGRFNSETRSTTITIRKSWIYGDEDSSRNACEIVDIMPCYDWLELNSERREHNESRRVIQK